VAEGVETEAVWDQLALLGCDVAQGYYLSRPVPAAELAEWLARRAGKGNAVPAQKVWR
jgi:EAL domain-containing protein (putative c-di-GMP-specific phosphodiesterase class I)